MKPTSDNWVRCYRPAPRAKLRLCCIAHAGGSAAFFRPWAERLPDSVELCAVELPGRGGRRREAPMTRLDPVVDALDRALGPDPRPLALFGHSMGALIVFELARRLSARPGKSPLHLFVSGHRAPQRPDRGHPLHRLEGPRLVEQLRSLNGTPPEIFEEPELLDLMLPILRADFELCETYVYRDSAPLACPVSAFGGEKDALVSPADLDAWREVTTGGFLLRMVAGDHFFVQSHPEPVLTGIIDDLGCSLSAMS